MSSLICENSKQMELVSNVLEVITSCFNLAIIGKSLSKTTTAIFNLLVRKHRRHCLVYSIREYIFMYYMYYNEVTNLITD
jgi:hypothetical protein